MPTRVHFISRYLGSTPPQHYQGRPPGPQQIGIDTGTYNPIVLREMKSLIKGVVMAKKPVTYCCSMMERWSKRDGVIHHSHAQQLIGIRTVEGGNAFISISLCPWCGTNVAMDIDKELIGKRMVDVTT
jgi:hypothetical protein